MFLDKPIIVDVDLPKTSLKHLQPTRGRFDHQRVTELLQMIYSPEEYQEMQAAGVDKRMMFGTNPHYHALAMGEELRDEDGSILVPKMPPSTSIAALVLPRLAEAADMAGEKDPAKQMNFTPEDAHGKLLHKYDEIVLGYTSPACSAHCRYCYRLDLFNKDTGKSTITPEELRDYIIRYNMSLAENNGIDPATGNRRYPIREVLLSGGDPMVLPNTTLFKFIVAAGQAGVHAIRIGTKELAFRPQRVDSALIETFQLAHERYPDLHINMVIHYSHPDEFLLRDGNGQYIPNESGSGYQWLNVSRQAIQRLASLSFVTLENQTPVILHVNDNEQALRILHEEVRRMGIKPKYIFQGRDIEAHKAFSLPVEQAWALHTNAMKGLSDTVRSRFSMSTEWGKMEVISVIEGIDADMPLMAGLPHEIRRLLTALLGDGLAVFRIHRSPHEAASQGDLIIARRNPEALWISGYEDRILYDSRRESSRKYTGLIALALKALDINILYEVVEDCDFVKDFNNDQQKIAVNV